MDSRLRDALTKEGGLKIYMVEGSATSMVTEKRTALIVGGGIIGSSIAYHLSQYEGAFDIIILEMDEVAGSASGKAGGFLARDWCDDSPVQEMAQKSFALHAELAEALGGSDKYGYRRLDTLSVKVKESLLDNPRCASSRQKHLEGILPDWVDKPSILHAKSIADTGNSAQVHPKLLTQTLVKVSQDRGVVVRKGRAVGVESEDGENKQKEVKALRVEDPISNSLELLSADVFIFAMGPWSADASSWFDLPKVTGQKAHSIVLRPSLPITPHALFLDYEAKDGGDVDPEVYPRPDGTVYICGVALSKRVKHPESPKAVKPSQGACEKLEAVASCLSSELGSAPVEVRQACFLPDTPDGLPIVGAIPNVQNAYIATGHSCWGILNSLSTGKATAELVFEGRSKFLNLSPFDPKRFVKGP